jgi:hypothetical protein
VALLTPAQPLVGPGTRGRGAARGGGGGPSTLSFPVLSNFERNRDRLAEALLPGQKARQLQGGGRLPSRADRMEVRNAFKGRLRSVTLTGQTRADIVGRFGVRLDGEDLEALIRDELAKVAPTLTRSMDTYLGGVAVAALRKWPVKSGLSRATLEADVELVGEYIRVRIQVLAWYWPYIRGHPHKELLEQPSELAVEKIASSTADLLTR